MNRFTPVDFIYILFSFLCTYFSNKFKHQHEFAMKLQSLDEYLEYINAHAEKSHLHVGNIVALGKVLASERTKNSDIIAYVNDFCDLVDEFEKSIWFCVFCWRKLS